jgi:hypothetical protein
VWSSRGAGLNGLSVTLDRRGAGTVAWAVHRGQGDTPWTIRAAYTNRLAGRWTRARAVGRGAPARPVPPYPRLAAGRDREVLLAWDGPARANVAWRRPGHRFGKPTALRHPRFRPIGPTPAFDAADTAYLSGRCTGFVLRTRPGGHRFGRAIMLGDVQALDFTLSVLGPGQGIASWIDGSCTFDVAAGPTPGPVFARVLRDGAFQVPLSLSAAGAQAYNSTGAADPEGGGTVSWSQLPGGPLTADLGPAGVVGPARPVTGAAVPVAVTGGGDQVFTRTHWSGGPPGAPGAFFVRPAGGGADEHAPVPYGDYGYAASTPTGRRVVLVLASEPRRLSLSVWRP